MTRRFASIITAALMLMSAGCSSSTNDPAPLQSGSDDSQPRPAPVAEAETAYDTPAGYGWTMGFAAEVIPIPGNSDQPLYIAGYNQGAEISGVLDMPRASAVWIEAGDEKTLLISVDCIALSSRTVGNIRTDLASFLSQTECTSVNIYATHTHAGIDTLGLWGPIARDGKNDDYMISLEKACVDAAHAAYENRKAGRLYYGKADADIIRDSREPIVYDSFLHQFRFEAEDGSGIRMVSYVAHAESLRSVNRKVSRDFPGLMCDMIKEETGDDFIYMPSAVGGLSMTKELTPADTQSGAELNMKKTAESLINSLFSITDEEEISPVLKTASEEITVPLDNRIFEYYRFLGILDTPAVRGEGSTGYAVISELGVMCLGDFTFALIPGEIFPELVSGEYFPDTRCASPENENPVPLSEIAASHGHSELFVIGLANDELGYIVTPNDFLVNPSNPYFEGIGDSYGENHYEETNSAGPMTAHVIAAALDSILGGLE